MTYIKDLADAVDRHNADQQPRLTEAEWQRHTAQRECAAHGHDWFIINTVTGPVRLKCERGCGDPGYTVSRNEYDLSGTERGILYMQDRAVEAVEALRTEVLDHTQMVTEGPMVSRIKVDGWLATLAEQIRDDDL